MRHHDNKRKFGRETGQRLALMRSLALSLIKAKKIKTTEAKAKELRPYIEKLITTATVGEKATVVNRNRLLTSKLGNSTGNKKLMDLAKEYGSRKGGYTRVTKLPIRKSDGAKMAVIEFV